MTVDDRIERILVGIDDVEPCRDCDGTGAASEEDVDADGYHQWFVTCTRCEGSGREPAMHVECGYALAAHVDGVCPDESTARYAYGDH